MMKLTFKKSFLLFLAICLTSCATTYHEFNFSGGYQSAKLAEDSYVVRFNGNGYTSFDLATQFTMRHCAEITLEQGKRYFVKALNPGPYKAKFITTSSANKFPTPQLIFMILDSKSDSPNVFDAVRVIDETNNSAKGILSPEAQKYYNILIENETHQGKES